MSSAKRTISAAPDANVSVPENKRQCDNNNNIDASTEYIRKLETDVAEAKRKLDEALKTSVEGCRQIRQERAVETFQNVLNQCIAIPMQLPHRFYISRMKLDWACVGGMDEFLTVVPISCYVTYGNQMLYCQLTITGGFLHTLTMALTQVGGGHAICHSSSPLASYVVRGDTLWSPKILDKAASESPGEFDMLLRTVPTVHSCIARMMFLLPVVAHLVPAKDPVCDALEHFPEAHRDSIKTQHVLIQCSPLVGSNDDLKRHVRECKKCTVHSVPVLSMMYSYMIYRCGTDHSDEEPTLYGGKLTERNHGTKYSAANSYVFETGWCPWDDSPERKFPTLERLECTNRVWAPFVKYMHGAVCRSGAEFYESLPADERWC